MKESCIIEFKTSFAFVQHYTSKVKQGMYIMIIINLKYNKVNVRKVQKNSSTTLGRLGEVIGGSLRGGAFLVVVRLRQLCCIKIK